MTTREGNEVKNTEKLKYFFKQLANEVNNQPVLVNRSEIDSLLEAGYSLPDILQVFVNEGLILHGSGVPGLTELTPRQGHEIKDIPENKLVAVYATIDPLPALFRALVSGISGTSSFSIDTFEGVDGELQYERSFTVDFDIPKNREGFVYVLSQDSFTCTGGHQFASAVPVKPMLVVPIKLSDFPYEIKKVES